MRAAFLAFAAAGCLRGAPVAPRETSDSGTPPVAPTVTLSYAMKTFVFSWPPVAGADALTVYETVDGLELPVAAVDGGATEARLTVPLFARVGAIYRVEACNAAGCAASPPLAIEPPLLDAVGYLKPATADFSALFGGDVATCADGSVVAVGASTEDGPGSPAFNGGAAYVFVRDPEGAWTQAARLDAPYAGDSEWFGSAIALSADCETLAVGAQHDDGGADGVSDVPDSADSVPNSGAVYLFQRSAGWALSAYVKGFPPTEGSSLGHQVALSGDGAVLAVAASFDGGLVPGVFAPGSVPDPGPLSPVGAVLVYRREGGAWLPEAYLKGSEISESDEFGASLALDDAGEWLAVGSPKDDTAGFNSGGVYVYHHDGAWTEAAYLHPPNTVPGSVAGRSVAISGDASTLVVGSALNGPYVYVNQGGTWTPEQAVSPRVLDPFSSFGSTVSVSGDGSWLAVGAPVLATGAPGVSIEPDGAPSVEASGAVYLFARRDGAYAQESSVRAAAPSEQDHFGDVLTISADGQTLVVGSPLDDGSATGVHRGGVAVDDLLADAGAVYLY